MEERPSGLVAENTYTRDDIDALLGGAHPAFMIELGKSRANPRPGLRI